jgi:putative PIN family toxin of toxin-antitoxin system
VTPALRVLIDTNVLLSYIVGPSGSERAIERAVRSAFVGDFVLLLPAELLLEIATVLQERPYFRQRISAEQATAYIQALLTVGQAMDPLPEQLPAIVRDVPDDYLIAAATIGDADYLVTGDKDLLALGDSVAPVVILSPADFVTGVLDRKR